MTAARVDTWIDLEYALVHIVKYVQDKLLYLLGLYCLLTQATTKEVAKTLGCSFSHLSAHPQRMRSTLVSQRPGYGVPSIHPPPLLLPDLATTAFPSAHSLLSL